MRGLALRRNDHLDAAFVSVHNVQARRFPNDASRTAFDQFPVKSLSLGNLDSASMIDFFIRRARDIQRLFEALIFK